MSFHDTRLPTTISYRPIGGPKFRTDIGITDNDYEYRNQAQATALCKWEVGYDARTKVEFDALLHFFGARRGRLYAFRFKDWSDFAATSAQGIFATLTSTTFQMYKQYTSTGTYNRRIQKPVTGTVTVTGGTTPVVDYTTGIVTVASGTPTAWAGEFDTPVRFDTDEMDGNMLTRSGTLLMAGWTGIPIKEVRL